MSCAYRSIVSGRAYSGICACPCGQHADGHTCIDDRRRCPIARKQDRVFAQAEREYTLYMSNFKKGEGKINEAG